ncbi:carboxypeptidase-like regulatory domain-containing protein [Pontibacter sp. 172403-2]|uniref:DUF5686 and carboxypeptidase-like regulatory domain-containing protein n=1 Tax=Pontibacter rufus TaxID=2791028 RepID=UPI0018AFD22E|nr:DUF5686 and carboxypeptidase-like regulatory domain-containing protein [Pontibacter sp. 172403-2]MBF9252902.1 carboxypeptidase-like regulatory domain-containing protein [Pontibacter sp. 172403-2]
MPYFRLLLTLYLFLAAVTASAQLRTVRGTVRDAQTNEKLAFVSIAANAGETGTTTNLEGEYQLRHLRPIQSLRFSYVGYAPQVIPVDSSETINVWLQPAMAQLQEVTVLASGENLAHRIIRLAIQNRERNDIKNLPAYTYRTYNKFILTATDAQNIDLSDTLQLSPKDSAYLQMRHLLARQHLFLAESVTDYAFLQPNLRKETILATHVSGLQQPSFGIVAAEARDFSVYDDMPVFFGKHYLSPLSPGSTRKYNFVLQETSVLGQDTVFIISFKPEEGKNFEGLKGLLYINSNGWAVQNVLAQTAANGEQRGLKLQQQFEQTGPQQQWFPTELDVEITVPQVALRGHQPYGHIRTYITNINLNPGLHKSDFGVVALRQLPDAASQTNDFWNRQRPDSLNQLELRTYTRLDSIGKAEKLDRTLRFVEFLTTKQLPLGPVSLDLNRLLRLSDFEGLRLGAGLHTNSRLSERFSVGGYWGYGFKDEATKYGADASVILYKPLELQLQAAYFQDLVEPGGRRLPFRGEGLLLKDLRWALLPYLDYTTHYSASLSGRLQRYLQLQTTLRHEKRRTTLDAALGKYNLTEGVVSLRYAYGEQFMEQFHQRMALPNEYPVLWLQYTRGFDGLLDGNYSYNKYEMRLEASYRHRTFGQSRLTFAGGYVDGVAPLVSLFNGYGSYSADYSVYAGEGFETMRPFEFFSDRYAALFVQQDFGKRLFRTKFFHPDIVAVTNIGFGDLEQPLSEQSFQTMRKGFYESGLLLNNIIQSAFSGIGAAAFYRYGPYAAASPKDNLVLKFTVTLAF